MGMAPVILQKLRLQEKERATATAKFAKQPLLLPLNLLRGVGAKATGSLWVAAFGVCSRSAEQVLQKRGRKGAATKSTG